MRRAVAILALALLLLGTGMSFKAAHTPQYSDATAFQKAVSELSSRYSAEYSRQSKVLEIEHGPSMSTGLLHDHMRKFEAGLNREYMNLLDTYEARRPLEHYGGTALVVGLLLLLAGPLGGRAMRTPSRRQWLKVAMFVPPLLTFGAYVLDSMEMLSSQNMPPWGEVPIMVLVLGFLVFGPFPVIWMVVHLLLVPEVYYRSQPLSLALSPRINPWLGLLALLAAGAACVTAWHGAWTWTVANLAWLYIHLAMAATRRAPHLYADLETEWPPAWNTAR